MSVQSRPRNKYSQAIRLVRTLELLKAKGDVTLSDLEQQFGISRRTAYRDITTLRKQYPVREKRNNEYGKGKVWYLTDKKNQNNCELRLNIMEMAALYMGKNLFNFTAGTELKQSIDQVFDKLSLRLAAQSKIYTNKLANKFYCTPGSPKDYRKHDDELNEIVTGLLHEKKVRISYRSTNGKELRDKICPLTLVIHNNALYLLADSEENGEIKVFSIERTTSAKWLRKESFKYPAKYSPESHLDDALGIMTGKPRPIWLKVSAEASEYFCQRRWHPSQKVLKHNDGSIDVRLSLPITYEIISWLLSFGASIKILEPADLKDEIAETAAQIVGLYKHDTQFLATRTVNLSKNELDKDKIPSV